MIYGVPCWNSFNWKDPGAILNSFRSTKGVNNHNDTSTVATVPLGGGGSDGDADGCNRPAALPPVRQSNGIGQWRCCVGSRCLQNQGVMASFLLTKMA